MHLERVVIVNEKGRPQDSHVPDLDISHTEGPLKYCGIVDDIDVLAYGDYQEDCDAALINYCQDKKPQAILMSLQNIRLRGGGPSPKAVWDITYRLNIPTIAFWFDIHDDRVAELLERYIPSVTLNVIGGADASSHKPMRLEGANYVYAGLAFDESLFNFAENERNIPVGFLGYIYARRLLWITKLRESGISLYTGGGPSTNTSTDQYRLSYKEYLNLTASMKITLNFSLLGVRDYNPVILAERGNAIEALHWLVANLKIWLPDLVKNPINKSKRILPVLKNTAPILLAKPRYMPRARVWEALWCRTFLLEEDNPVTAVYFEPYVDYVPFTTPKDLAEKIGYYLEHDSERDCIRMQGRATVEKYYNARMYCENLFEAIGIPSGHGFIHQPGEIWNMAHFENWLTSKNKSRFA